MNCHFSAWSRRTVGQVHCAAAGHGPGWMAGIRSFLPIRKKPANGGRGAIAPQSGGAKIPTFRVSLALTGMVCGSRAMVRSCMPWLESAILQKEALWAVVKVEGDPS